MKVLRKYWAKAVFAIPSQCDTISLGGDILNYCELKNGGFRCILIIIIKKTINVKNVDTKVFASGVMI